jgi:hypothetical protein
MYSRTGGEPGTRCFDTGCHFEMIRYRGPVAREVVGRMCSFQFDAFKSPGESPNMAVRR